VAKLIAKHGRTGNLMKWREMLNADCPMGWPRIRRAHARQAGPRLRAGAHPRPPKQEHRLGGAQREEWKRSYQLFQRLEE
jgi:hypothetical protein